MRHIICRQYFYLYIIRTLVSFKISALAQMILALKGVVNRCLKMGGNLKKDWIFKCYQEPGLVEAANA